MAACAASALQLKSLDGGARLLGLHFEIAKAVLFRQPPRGRRRRLGCLRKSVPAPEIALDRDQPLARLQMMTEVRALRPGHQPDLDEPAVERGRRRNPFGQRCRPGRQVRIAAAS